MSDENEAQKCRRMAGMLRTVPGGVGEVIDYLESRAALLDKVAYDVGAHQPAIQFHDAGGGIYPCRPLSEWTNEELLGFVSDPKRLNADIAFARGEMRFDEHDAIRAHMREKREELDRRGVTVAYPKDVGVLKDRA